MLAFQNTSLYQNTLSLMDELLKTLDKSSNNFLKEKIWKKAMNVTENIAKALNKDDQEEKEAIFEEIQEDIFSLISIVQLAIKTDRHHAHAFEKSLHQLTELHETIEHYPHHQKRILVLSATYGQGHMTAAKAIKEGFEALYGYDYQIEVVDFVQILNAVISKAGAKLYEGSTKFMPTFYKFFYTSTDQKWQVKLLNLINYPFAVTKLTKFFKEKNPDIIISTFPVWDYIAANIWKKFNPQAKFVSIVTDSISIHHAWVTADTDYHIVANIDTAHSLEQLGVSADKIKTLGFPVKLDFLQQPDRDVFLKKQGLNPKFFTILFLPTSQAPRKNIKIMKELVEYRKDLNIIVITGRDPKATDGLKKFSDQPNVKMIGWTDEMPAFIQCSHVVITKAGGATTMECIAAQKPMIISSIIEGQENGNAELIKRYKLGIIIPETKMTIIESMEMIQKNYHSFVKNLQKISKADAAIKIAEFVHGLLNGHSA